MTTNVAIGPDQLCINGVAFDRPVPPSDFFEILGTPSRSGDFYTKPAPYGFRNNQLHMFDALGIALNEHHASRLVGDVAILFDIAEAIHPTMTPFTGILTIAGRSIQSGTLEKEISEIKIPFEHYIGGEWSSNSGKLWIGLSFKGQERRGRRRSKLRRLVEIHVGLRGSCHPTRRFSNLATPAHHPAHKCPEYGTPVPAKTATMNPSKGSTP